MHMRAVLMGCMLLLLMEPCLSQHNNRCDTLDAYRRRTSLGVGLALPYLEREQLYSSVVAGPYQGAPYELEDQWRNVFTYESVVSYEAFAVRGGFQPTDRWELSLNYWDHSGAYDDGGDFRYSMRFRRLTGNVLYRPSIPVSARLRPVVGIAIARDRRDHEFVFVGSTLGTYTCATRAWLASAVMGLRLEAGPILFGLDLGLTSLAHIHIDYADKLGGGGFDHWMGPASAFKEHYSYGPIMLHVNYTL